MKCFIRSICTFPAIYPSWSELLSWLRQRQQLRPHAEAPSPCNAGRQRRDGDGCVRGGERDLERLWLLLFHGIVPTVCNPVVIGAVQCGSIPLLLPSPASAGSGCCISLLFICWCINLGFIGEEKAEQSGFSAPGI